MVSSARPGRPLLVTILGVLPFALAVWYVVLAIEATLLFAGDALFGGTAPIPTDVRLGPVAILVAAIGAMLWSFLTAGGLLGGAGWARLSAILLALFALPMGYPSDLAVAALVILVLFFPSNVRAYFRLNRR